MTSESKRGVAGEAKDTRGMKTLPSAQDFGC